MAKKKRSEATEAEETEFSESPDVLDAAASEPAPVAPAPKSVKRFEAPAPGDTVKVRNVSRATCNGIAPGAVGELPATHPGLHPLALEFELVKG